MSTSQPRQDDPLVRMHVVTGGRHEPSRNHFNLHTLVISRPELPLAELRHEARQVVELCLPGALSVAEISAYLTLPVSVVLILLVDLMDSSHITIHSQIPRAVPPPRATMEAVLAGLQRI